MSDGMNGYVGYLERKKETCTTKHVSAKEPRSGRDWRWSDREDPQSNMLRHA